MRTAAVELEALQLGRLGREEGIRPSPDVPIAGEDAMLALRDMGLHSNPHIQVSVPRSISVTQSSSLRQQILSNAFFYRFYTMLLYLLFFSFLHDGSLSLYNIDTPFCAHTPGFWAASEMQTVLVDPACPQPSRPGGMYPLVYTAGTPRFFSASYPDVPSYFHSLVHDMYPSHMRLSEPFSNDLSYP